MPDAPKHPGGRPRLDARDESVHVGITIPAKQYAAYAKEALRNNLSIPEVIRRQLRNRAAADPPR